MPSKVSGKASPLPKNTISGKPAMMEVPIPLKRAPKTSIYNKIWLYLPALLIKEFPVSMASGLSVLRRKN